MLRNFSSSSWSIFSCKIFNSWLDSYKCQSIYLWRSKSNISKNNGSFQINYNFILKKHWIRYFDTNFELIYLIFQSIYLLPRAYYTLIENPPRHGVSINRIFADWSGSEDEKIMLHIADNSQGTNQSRQINIKFFEFKKSNFKRFSFKLYYSKT